MPENARTSWVESKWTRFGVLLTATGSIALTGCSSSSDNPDATSKATRSSSVSIPQPTDAERTPKAGVPMTFDDLAGGSSIIQVYQGARDTPEDKSVTGTYRDGDTASAECKTIGRIVTSDPTLGEKKLSSNQWIRLAEGPSTGIDPQYATAVYIHKPGELLLHLPNC